jgi:hypothetical protein
VVLAGLHCIHSPSAATSSQCCGIKSSIIKYMNKRKLKSLTLSDFNINMTTRLHAQKVLVYRDTLPSARSKFLTDFR